MDPRIDGARDLTLAIFRLAVADYLGLAFGHDGPGPARRTRRAPYVRASRPVSPKRWARYLADLIGLEASAIWREARKVAAKGIPARASRQVIAA